MLLGLKQAGELKKCGGNCRKTLPLSSFKLKSNMTRSSYCVDCLNIIAKRNEAKPVPKLANNEKKCAWCNKVKCVTEFRLKADGNPYAHCDNCKSKHTEGQAKYTKTPAGVETKKRYLQGPKGIAKNKRHNSKRVELRRFDPCAKLDHSLSTIASMLISGKRISSEFFVERTGFESVDRFVALVSEDCVRKGFNMSEYGFTWQLDHKIPRTAYRFDVERDVRCCWSPKNVHCLSIADNKAKSLKLLDHYLMEAGAENFPVSWDGKLPDEEFKRNFYARCLAPKDVGGPSTIEPPRDAEDGPDSESD